MKGKRGVFDYATLGVSIAGIAIALLNRKPTIVCPYCGYEQKPKEDVFRCESCSCLVATSEEHVGKIQKMKMNRKYDMIDGISIRDVEEYGYHWDGMIPIRPETAEKIYRSGKGPDVYRIYYENSEGLIEDDTDFSDLTYYGIEVERYEEYKKRGYRLPNKKIMKKYR